MKKIFTIFILLSSFWFVDQVSAASARIQVNANKSSIVVGNSVTVTVIVSADVPMANWEYDLNYDTSLFTMTSSDYNTHNLGFDMTQNKKTASYTYTFKAKKAGTGSFTLGASAVLGWDGELSLSKGGSTVKIITQEQQEATYSKNNNLASLSIDGYTLTPNFDKNTTEYNLEVENDIKSIVIKATKEDSTASISGTGEVSVSEGKNVLKVTVTAQNGSTKTYAINVTVKELMPINVKIGDQDYSVIRKADALPQASRFYEETTITINDQQVPAYHSNTTKFTLVGLKDSAGTIKLFIYDNGEYKKYNEINFSQVSLYLLEPEIDIPLGFEKVDYQLGNETVTAYQNKNQIYPLLYGLNLETGEKNFYRYDSQENSLQRYMEIKDTEKQIYFYAVIGLCSLLVLTYIIIIIYLVNKNKKKKIKLENTMKLSKKDIVEIKEESKKEVKNKKQLKEAKTKEKEEQKKMRKEFLKDDEKFAKKAKKLDEKREALLGKTMVDITGIQFEDKNKE